MSDVIEQSVQEAEFETFRNYELLLKQKEREISKLQNEIIELKDSAKEQIDDLKEKCKKLSDENQVMKSIMAKYPKDKLIDNLNYDGLKEKYDNLQRMYNSSIEEERAYKKSEMKRKFSNLFKK